MRAAVTGRGAISRELPTRAGTIHVYDVPGNPNGKLPTIVILHGIAASSAGFAPIFMRLRQHAKRVIVPDYPGHGLSREPSVRLTLDALYDAMTGALDELLGDEPFAIVGNSLGGVVALDYAMKRQERCEGVQGRKPLCEGVVLFSPAGAASTTDEWNELMGAFGAKTRREAIAFMHRVYHRIPLPAYLLAHELPQTFRARGPSDIFGSVSSETAIPEKELAALKMPILFSWGQSERLLPASHLGWWKSHLPAHAVVEQPVGMGHCPHFDAPQRLADRIVSFLNQS